jgi:HD-like signal output (HDOD) protein
MVRKVEKLKGNLFLEKKLSDMIAKIKRRDRDAASWQKIGEVVKLIETLSYQVLRLVNNPMTAFRRTNDIVDASYQLGARRLEQLLKTIRFSKLLPGELHAYGTSRDAFWEHSIVTGLFTQIMAKKSNLHIRYYDAQSEKTQTEGDFYFLGLLHDFGMVILDQIFTDFYREIILKNDKGYFSYYRNEKELQVDHAKIGAWAMKEANFPLQFARAILHHHCPSEAEDDIKALCAILYLAEYFQAASFKEYGSQESASEDFEEALWAADYLQMDILAVRDVIEQLQVRFV